MNYKNHNISSFPHARVHAQHLEDKHRRALVCSRPALVQPSLLHLGHSKQDLARNNPHSARSLEPVQVPPLSKVSIKTCTHRRIGPLHLCVFPFLATAGFGATPGGLGLAAAKPGVFMM